jgi:hypothetical protein
MLGVIGELLPIALAVALSSVPIMATVTILLSPTGARPALAFLISWVAGMFLVAGVFSLFLQTAPLGPTTASQPTIGVAEMVVGVALSGYGLWMLLRRRPTTPSSELPRWLRAVGTVRPSAAAGLALVLNVRPKALLLAAATGLFIGPAHLNPPDATICLALYTVIGASTVGVPVILALTHPGTIERPLRAAKAWIARNSRSVTLVVVIVVGVVVFGNGLARL